MGLGYGVELGDVPLLQLGKRNGKAVKEHAQGHQWQNRTQENRPLPLL